MSKLLTPVHYSPGFDALNEPRPLQVTDKLDIHLANLIGNSNPIGDIAPARGKIIQCDNQGALLCKNSAGFEGYDYFYEEYHWPGFSTQHIDFSRYYGSFMIKILREFVEYAVAFASPSDIWIKELADNVLYTFTMKFNRLYFSNDAPDSPLTKVWLYCFY